MSKPTSDRPLDAAQARRLLNRLSLRPGERILCLGSAGGAVPSVAAILVGPTGRIVEAAPPSVADGGTLPHPDEEFDAVILDLTSTPHPDQTPLLAEAARVTAPTGRVAVAVSPSGSAAPVQQIAESAGLRGVAVRIDPDGEPVQFVTAFPPRPAASGDDIPTAEFGVATPAARPDPAEPVGRPAKSRRIRLLVAGAAALVVAAAAGLLWGLAGTDSGQDPPEDRSDLLAGTGDLDADQPGTDGQPPGEGLPVGGLPTNDTASGSVPDVDSGGSGGSSGGSSESDGGRSSNRPPVIDSPGLSSTGLVLLLRPEVSDPDGDDVALLYDVDGMEVDPAQQQGRLCQVRAMCTVELDFADIGYQRDVPVTIIATDSHGATTREKYSHTISTQTNVTFGGGYAINDPKACLESVESLDLRIEYTLSGGLDYPNTPFPFTIPPEPPEWEIDLHRETYFGEKPPPVKVSLVVSLSGFRRIIYTARPHTVDTERTITIGDNSECQGEVTYNVRFVVS